MSLKRLRIEKCVSILVLLLCWTGCQAAAAGPPSERPFSGQELDKLIVDWPRFVRWARQHGEEFDQVRAPDRMFEELFSRQAAEFIAQMGWQPDRFSYVVGQVTIGLAGLKMNEEGGQVLAYIEARQKEIRADPDLSDDQKRRLLDELGQSAAEMKRFQDLSQKMPPQERQLIRTNRQELKKVLADLYRNR